MKINDKRNTIRKHPTKRPPTRTLNQITDIAIHHSLTTSGSAEAFANFHVGTNGWSVMGYAYVINRNGSIDWCADYTVVTPHVGNHNRYSLGICMVGDFRTQTPTKEQYDALLWLINHVQSKLPNKCKIVGHSEYSGYTWKACPVIDMNKVRSDVVAYSKDKAVTVSQPQTTTTQRILRLASPLMNGNDVKELQVNLNKLGFNCGNPDGYFGNMTDTAVRNFQRKYGLTVDGIVGNGTFAKIDEVLNTPKPEPIKNEDIKIIETKGGNKPMELTPTLWKIIEDTLRKEHAKGVLSSAEWAELAKSKKLSNDQATAVLYAIVSKNVVR